MDRSDTLKRYAPDGLAALIAVSGIAELVCAAGLFRRERWAGPASALLLVAVFPSNVWFAMGAPSEQRSQWFQIAALLRLPLQIPLIAAALAAGRPPRPSRHRRR
jgi:uncharacterized membrane protein